jgi:hypothetical protein
MQAQEENPAAISHSTAQTTALHYHDRDGSNQARNLPAIKAIPG